MRNIGAHVINNLLDCVHATSIIALPIGILAICYCILQDFLLDDVDVTSFTTPLVKQVDDGEPSLWIIGPLLRLLLVLISNSAMIRPEIAMLVAYPFWLCWKFKVFLITSLVRSAVLLILCTDFLVWIAFALPYWVCDIIYRVYSGSQKKCVTGPLVNKGGPVITDSQRDDSIHGTSATGVPAITHQATSLARSYHPDHRLLFTCHQRVNGAVVDGAQDNNLMDDAQDHWSEQDKNFTGPPCPRENAMPENDANSMERQEPPITKKRQKLLKVTHIYGNTPIIKAECLPQILRIDYYRWKTESGIENSWDITPKRPKIYTSDRLWEITMKNEQEALCPLIEETPGSCLMIVSFNEMVEIQTFYQTDYTINFAIGTPLLVGHTDQGDHQKDTHDSLSDTLMRKLWKIM